MMAFDLRAEQEFSLEKNVEKILGSEPGGDVTVRVGNRAKPARITTTQELLRFISA